MRRNRGFALIEVLAALAVLAVAGLALVRLARATLDATARVAEAERAQLDAERLLVAYTLLDRGDLERRVGQRAVGPFMVSIRRDGLELFDVRVAAMDRPVELVTTVYRPEALRGD